MLRPICYISMIVLSFMYQIIIQFANEVLKQLTRGMGPHKVKVEVRLANIKPLHANWIIQAYHY